MKHKTYKNTCIDDSQALHTLDRQIGVDDATGGIIPCGHRSGAGGVEDRSGVVARELGEFVVCRSICRDDRVFYRWMVRVSIGAKNGSVETDRRCSC